MNPRRTKSGRFTVCCHWPLGHPSISQSANSKTATLLVLEQQSAKNQFFIIPVYYFSVKDTQKKDVSNRRVNTTYLSKNRKTQEILIDESFVNVLKGIEKHPESSYVFCYENGTRRHDFRKVFTTALKNAKIEIGKTAKDRTDTQHSGGMGKEADSKDAPSEK